MTKKCILFALFDSVFDFFEDVFEFGSGRLEFSEKQRKCRVGGWIQGCQVVLMG